MKLDKYFKLKNNLETFGFEKNFNYLQYYHFISKIIQNNYSKYLFLNFFL
jgi:hypothetical protein